MPKFASRLFSLYSEDARSQIRSSSCADMPRPVLRMHSFGVPSIWTAVMSTHLSIGAVAAASIALTTNSRIIMVLGQRSIVLETRNASFATRRAATGATRRAATGACTDMETPGCDVPAYQNADSDAPLPATDAWGGRQRPRLIILEPDTRGNPARQMPPPAEKRAKPKA